MVLLQFNLGTFYPKPVEECREVHLSVVANGFGYVGTVGVAKFSQVTDAEIGLKVAFLFFNNAYDLPPQLIMVGKWYGVFIFLDGR